MTAEQVMTQELRAGAQVNGVAPPREPVRVDEGAATPVAEDDSLLRELRQRACDGRPADRVLRAELMLRREPLLHAVATAENLLEQQRLQLVVERNRLRRVDRHRVTLCHPQTRGRPTRLRAARPR